MTVIGNDHPGDTRSGPGPRKQPSEWLRWGNRVIIGLQRLGLAFGPQHLLMVPGRRTGKPRTTPVAVVPIAGARYLMQAFPGALAAAAPRCAVFRIEADPER